MAQTSKGAAGAAIPVDAIHTPVVPAGAGLRTHQQTHQDDHEVIRQALSAAADLSGPTPEGNQYPAGQPYTTNPSGKPGVYPGKRPTP